MRGAALGESGGQESDGRSGQLSITGGIVILDWLRENQLVIMLMLSGICGTVAFFVLISKTLSPKRRTILTVIELSAMMLMVFDRYAYIFRGDVSRTGWWMVRISNFGVFFLLLVMTLAFNFYLRDLYLNEGGMKDVPMRLKISEFLLFIGMVLVVISQFTGFYYTFDDTNHYQRAPAFILCYVIPTVCMLLQMSVIMQFYDKLSRWIRISLLLFTGVIVVVSFLQIKTYGLSLTNLSAALMAVFLYILAITDTNAKVEQANKLKIEYLKEEQKSLRRLFEQTATALASAIDAKDKYTHGHSTRVAEYSRTIAQLSGKSEKECNEIYYAALLHDVGKIGISNEIINKDGKLTPEEYEVVKRHPVIGKQILSGIVEFPYLSIGAHHHHERYDGKGYPDKLKGNDIPDIARIIAVADAYDAMTSKRSYRDPLPQQKVREEMIRESGEQFDPEYARIMLHLIDLDTEYKLKEREDVKELSGNDELVIEKYRSYISEGILINPKLVKIHLEAKPLEGYTEDRFLAAMILFDSLDERVHDREKDIEYLCYHEYAEIRSDGKVDYKGSRKMQTKTGRSRRGASASSAKARIVYDIEAVKVKDHLLIRIDDGSELTERIIALPDSVRYAYMALTGAYCHIDNVSISRAEEAVPDDYIPRIAEEVSHIDSPAGDIPNVQVNGYRYAASAGIPVKDGMVITFHTKSLPTARLIWHCPFVSVFSSENGLVNGPAFREYALLRLDGETWDSGEYAVNELTVEKKEGFLGWEDWKKHNREGMDCEVRFAVEENVITITTTNAGIALRDVVTVNDGTSDIYVALTGDQVALTNIKIRNN